MHRRAGYCGGNSFARQQYERAKNKYEIYEESGVKEYWVVSPQDNTFIVYTLINGKYNASRLMVAGDIITSSVLEGFSLDLIELFERAQ